MRDDDILAASKKGKNNEYHLFLMITSVLILICALEIPDGHFIALVGVSSILYHTERYVSIRPNSVAWRSWPFVIDLCAITIASVAVICFSRPFALSKAEIATVFFIVVAEWLVYLWGWIRLSNGLHLLLHVLVVLKLLSCLPRSHPRTT